MKNKIKLTEKLLETLGIDIPIDQIKDNCIKRINYNQDFSEERTQYEDGYSNGVITSIDVDSDGDVVMPRGIDLSRYEKNPVVLFNHSLAEPIGYAEKLIVNDDKIWAKTRFGTTDEAQRIHQLILDKVLRTHSIGFITTEATVRGEVGFDSLLGQLKTKFPDKFDDISSKKVDRIITGALLIEYSIVTIPSNEEAVISEIKEIKEKNLEIKQIEDVVEEIEEEVDVVEVVEEAIEETVVEPVELAIQAETIVVEPVVEVEVEEDVVLVTKTDSTHAIVYPTGSTEVEVTPKEITPKEIEIKVIKRASSLKKVSSLEEIECEKLKKLYRSKWGC